VAHPVEVRRSIAKSGIEVFAVRGTLADPFVTFLAYESVVFLRGFVAIEADSRCHGLVAGLCRFRNARFVSRLVQGV